MRRGIFIWIFLFCVFPATAQERRFQLWNLNGLEIKLNDKYSVGANEKLQYRPATGNISSTSGDLFVKREIYPWFDVSVAGRVLCYNGENGWIQENRAMIYGNMEKEFGRFSFDLSNRFEYRMFEIMNDHFRHRHMFSIETFPFTNAPWFNLYVSEEGFYLIEEDKFHLIRFYSGTRVKYSKTFEMKLYYAFEKSRRPLYWNASDVLGLNVKANF